MQAAAAAAARGDHQHHRHRHHSYSTGTATTALKTTTTADIELPDLKSSSNSADNNNATTTTTTMTATAAATATTAPLVACSEHLLQPMTGVISGREVAESILPRFPDLISAIPVSNRPALSSSCDHHHNNSIKKNRNDTDAASDDSYSSLTHTEIRQFLISTGRILHEKAKIGRGSRVAVILPNGPELALSILLFTCYCSCVPLNAFGAVQELEADLLRASIDHVVCLNDNAEIQALANKLHIPCSILEPDPTKAGLFSIHPPTQAAIDDICIYDTDTLQQQIQDHQHHPPLSPRIEADRSAGGDDYNTIFCPNQHSDEVLVLFTSGTTGSKKLVPHLLQDVLIATACIAVSWKLGPNDTNCNLMPLFHVGGIIRQVFSPILSGGCVICCPSFDPNVFWSLLSQNLFTWYYAAPTMHHLILQTGRSDNYIGQSYCSKLRMIANAAGGLLPSLARELRQVFFHAHILPSYGMTECMPITSPPSDYLLEKPGTSGVAVGPEIAILNLKTVQRVQCNKEGAICVRGEPCFRGYAAIAGEDEGNTNTETFLPGGWFNTGDLGYLDSDGYLYITGRAKEVVNRGGEIISPMEVEEAVLSHPSVKSCVAFSTQHSVLQEVVGILLVPIEHEPRIDLPTLHAYLGQGRLAAPKWPQCIVYTDAVPKSFTNKLLRVKLGKRLSLPELNDNMYPIERIFQAKCPPQGAPVSVAIPCERVSVSPLHVQTVLRQALDLDDLVVLPHQTKMGALVCYVRSNVDRLHVVQTAQRELHAYLVPGHVCVCLTGSPAEASVENQPPQSSDAVGSILQEASSIGRGPSDPLVLELQELMQVLLDLDCLPAPDSCFFNLGGSSMLASQLASKIRKQHNVPFGGAEVFHSSSCNDIANVVRERQQPDPENGSSTRQSVDPDSMAASSLFSFKLDLSKTPFDATRMEIRSGFGALLFQLVPLLVIYPLWQMTRFFAFFRTLLWVLARAPEERNLYKFVLTVVIFHGLWVTITPLFFVLVKWIIIGKYRPGRYPIWSEQYLRWWFVDVLRKLIGRGSWGAHPQTLNIYYRMLGAKIGKGARISIKADVAEFDLVSVGAGAAVELSTLRGFGVDNGSMILGPVAVGNHASVGARSVVAPYTSVPDHMHLGPVTSSYEMSGATEQDNKHLRYNRQALQEPTLLSQCLVISPITFFVDTLSHIPALLVLYWMIEAPWNFDEPFRTIGDLIEWLADPRRIPFFIGIRIARAVLAPFFYMAGCILVKWLVIGRFEPGPRDTTSEWQLIRHHLASTLFSRENMQEVAELLGRHYELISVLYRLLGAKVGKRVFWPGRQPVFSGEFDLLEIGDDVVFGSRGTLICTTVDSCEKIKLCAGSNVSDNTVVLPGSVIGKGAVLGSNSVCPEGRYLPESSVWLGARKGQPVLLEKGVEDSNLPVHASEIDQSVLQMDGDETTLRPFGRALYQGESDYFVLPYPLIIAFTVITRFFIGALNTLPILGALHLAAGYFYGWPIRDRNYQYEHPSDSSVFIVLLCFFMFTHLIHVFIWVGMELFSKWSLMGEREEGRFNYDTSNYGQNWELYQIFSRVREVGRMNFLDFICGTPYMASFFRMLGCKIGDECCLYPAGGDPYMPEPDLVTMGDRCVVDCSSVVCHLNTRGNFELAKITMQNNVTLRTRSRIQQGVHMETGSMLLEKSLAMTGEVIEADSIWLGAPAARLMSYDNSSIGTRPTASYAGSHHGSNADEYV